MSVYVRKERVWFPTGRDERTAREIATPPYRWKHLRSFAQDGQEFEIWINWDGRARVECNNVVVLSMWWPAGEVFEAMEFRHKAQSANP